MSNERNELAAVIEQAYTLNEGMVSFELLASAALAAGYRKPRTIETYKQLKDEHAGLVVIDGNGMVWKIDGRTDDWINIEEGDSELYADEDIPLPVTVLHEAVTV